MMFQRLSSSYLKAMLLAMVLIYIILILIAKQNDKVDVLPIVDDNYLTEKYSDLMEIQLQHCKCKRNIMQKNSENESISYTETTCGQDAYSRGSRQKVVAFSFYGDTNEEQIIQKGYFQGIVENLDLMPKFYPGWIMRLYFDLDAQDPLMKQLCQLACNSTILDLCQIRALPGTPLKNARKVFAMIWRFFPTLDPQVNLYNSRDLDSRFSEREVAAVNEWLQIGEAIHAMRDHPEHNMPLLGGLFGTDLRRKNTRYLWKASWDKVLADSETYARRGSHGHDQRILTRYIWPWAQHMSVQHDSYNCLYFTKADGFPTERKKEVNNFVASVVRENKTLWDNCPRACRRKGHPEWEHC